MIPFDWSSWDWRRSLGQNLRLGLDQGVLGFQPLPVCLVQASQGLLEATWIAIFGLLYFGRGVHDQEPGADIHEFPHPGRLLYDTPSSVIPRPHLAESTPSAMGSTGSKISKIWCPDSNLKAFTKKWWVDTPMAPTFNLTFAKKHGSGRSPLQSFSKLLPFTSG